MSKIKKIVFGFVVVLAGLFAIGMYTLPEYYFNRGVEFYNQDDFKNAYKNFWYAKKLVPSNSDYRYYYVQTLTKFKPTLRIQKEMFDFYEDGKKDSANVMAGVQLAIWKNNIDKLYGANYIEQAPVNTQIIRWNPKTFPLKVYIGLMDVATVPEYYNTESIRAFGQWQTSAAFLSFKFIDTPDNADIVLKFEPLPKNRCLENGCKYVVGHTVPTIKNDILKQMTITIYDKDANGSYFSDKELYNTVLHEIGHALGIMGHSYSTDDLMYLANEGGKSSVFTRFRGDFKYISFQDVSTLRLLYNIVPTVTNTPISEINTENLIYPPVIFGTTKNMSIRKIKEAENYIRIAPNVPNGYIDLAIAYGELGKFEEAVEALTKAFNLATASTDKFIVLYNFAVMYLNDDKPETALQYAKQAQQVNNTEEVADLISNIEHALETKKPPFKGKRMVK